MASAGPSTFMLNNLIKTISRTILIREARARKITGVLLSPSERMIAARILYKKVNGMPRKMISMYICWIMLLGYKVMRGSQTE